MTHKHDRCSQIWDGRKGNLARPKGAVQCVTFTQKHRLSVQECVSRIGIITCSSQHGFKCMPEGTTPLNRIFQHRDSAATSGSAKLYAQTLMQTDAFIANAEVVVQPFCLSTLFYTILYIEWSCLDKHQCLFFMLSQTFFPCRNCICDIFYVINYQMKAPFYCMKELWLYGN